MKLLTIGTFDTPHMGHAAFLRRCAAFGEVAVGVNSDAFVALYKGTPPLYTCEERRALIEALGYTTLLNDGPGRDLIEAIEPDVLAIGSDWSTRDYHGQIGMTQLALDTMGCALLFVPYTPGISTTGLRERLA